jgi:hypothetical protein
METLSETDRQTETLSEIPLIFGLLGVSRQVLVFKERWSILATTGQRVHVHEQLLENDCQWHGPFRLVGRAGFGYAHFT